MAELEKRGGGGNVVCSQTIGFERLLSSGFAYKNQLMERFQVIKGNRTIAHLRCGKNTLSVLAHSFLLP